MVYGDGNALLNFGTAVVVAVAVQAAVALFVAAIVGGLGCSLSIGSEQP